MNANVRVLVQMIIDMYGGDQERHWASTAICKTQYSWRQLKDITRKLANDSGCVKE